MDLRLVSRDCEFGDFSGAGFVPSASNRYASWMSMKLAMPPVLTFEDFTETEIADAQALGAEASIAVQPLLEQLRDLMSGVDPRSAGRHGGNEGVCTCRTRWSQFT